jgi:D-lactate dehydrogenase
MLAESLLAALRALLGDDHVHTDPATRELYASDETPQRCPPEAVVFPTSHAQVADLVRLANQYRLPLIARGAGSGNVGGALPMPGSVVVSFECMRRVIEFNPDDRLIVVEPGVVTEDIDRLARSAGLMYAPDRKSTRLNSSHNPASRMPSSA